MIFSSSRRGVSASPACDGLAQLNLQNRARTPVSKEVCHLTDEHIDTDTSSAFIPLRYSRPPPSPVQKTKYVRPRGSSRAHRAGKVGSRGTASTSSRTP